MGGWVEGKLLYVRFGGLEFLPVGVGAAVKGLEGGLGVVEHQGRLHAGHRLPAGGGGGGHALSIYVA